MKRVITASQEFNDDFENWECKEYASLREYTKNLEIAGHTYKCVLKECTNFGRRSKCDVTLYRDGERLLGQYKDSFKDAIWLVNAYLEDASYSEFLQDSGLF